MDWLYFAILVAIVAVVGIAVGLFFAGRLARRGERRVADDDDTGTTAVVLAGAAGDARENGDPDTSDGNGNGGGDGGGGNGGGGD